jgi:hypothetical protein
MTTTDTNASGTGQTAALAAAVASCRAAIAPSRELDAEIARAMFPAIRELANAGEAAWLHGDGSRVRALRYSGSRSAASTLVPRGCWLEVQEGRATVCSPEGTWCGVHRLEPVAVCIAAREVRDLPRRGLSKGLRRTPTHDLSPHGDLQ